MGSVLGKRVTPVPASAYVQKILDAFTPALERETGVDYPASDVRVAFFQDSQHPGSNYAWAFLVTNGGEQWYVMKKGNYVHCAEIESANDVTHKAILTGNMIRYATAAWLEYIMEGNDLVYVNVNQDEYNQIADAVANLTGYKMTYSFLTYE